MATSHSTPEIIWQEVGCINTDIMAGWEEGLKGKKRIGGRLYDRHPPDHLFEPHNLQRLNDWLLGQRKALLYRTRYLSRCVIFNAYNQKDGLVTIRRCGWGVKRGQVVSTLEKKGCAGDVYVYYLEGGKTVREVKCGI